MIHHRALSLFAAIAMVVMAACKNEKRIEHSDDNEICHLDKMLELDEELGKASMRCHAQNGRDTPVLYAHYLTKSARDEICTAEDVEDDRGAINCAPGPLLLSHGNSIDGTDREWKLTSLPDYFAWHLDDKSSVDEMIYIANANGFPIKSQSIKLENEHDSTLVLFPKTALTPGAKYYLYLVRKTPNNEEKQQWIQQQWIQLISTSASNEMVKETVR
jgi:hypothetical protein